MSTPEVRRRAFTPWRIGCAVALVMALGVLLVCGGGLSGVPIGSRTFRIVWQGGAPEGRPILEQTWHTDAPWRGGFLSTSTFDVEGEASREADAVVGRVARRRWAFYAQRIEEVVLGVTRGGSERDVLHFQSDADPNAPPDLCATAAGTDVARASVYAVSAPLCILYPESASEVEVTIDTRPAASFSLEQRGGPHRFTLDEPLLVAAGGTQVFEVHGVRLEGVGTGRGDVTARLEAAAVPEALWREVRGDDVDPEVFTEDEWRSLSARVRAEGDPGWQLALEHGVLTVTAPPQAGSRVRLVVIGYQAGDQLAIVQATLTSCVSAEAFAAAMAGDDEGD